MKGAPTHRLSTLDSLRGIAALIVVFGHCTLIGADYFYMHAPLWVSFTPLRFLTNGYACVILFFILSGYVLSIPFLRGKLSPYLAFAAKRFCRIYLPFFIAILVAAGLYAASNPVIGTLGSDWFRKEWGTSQLTFELIFRHLAMIGEVHDFWLDGVIWSLIHELRISLIFPFLMILCRNSLTGIIIAIFMYVGTTLIAAFSGNNWSQITSDTFAGTFLITLRFIPFFMLGILLAKHNDAILDRLNRISPRMQLGILVFAVLLMGLPPEIHNKRIMALLSLRETSGFLKYGAEVLFGLASAYLIIAARNIGYFKRFLGHEAVNWLGRISYSLYLIHLPIALFLFRALLGHMHFLLITVSVITTSLIAAWLFYHSVERPSMRVGRSLAERFK